MSEARRRSILSAATEDAELVGQIPPVVAAGFGILPLRRLGDVLTVACGPTANRKALRLLRDVLDVEIVATAFPERELQAAIEQAYFPGEDATVNFPTFLEGDFLEDPASAPLLRREKEEELGPIDDDAPQDAVILATILYRTTVDDLDGLALGAGLPDPRRTHFEIGGLDTGWRTEAGVPHVYLGGESLAGARAVVTQFRQSDARHLRGGWWSCEHGIRTDRVAALPVVIHPSEVQITGLRPDGGLRLHVYDRREVVAPGQPAAFDLAYYFLSSGHRLRRRIRVEVSELVLAPRASLVAHEELGAPWTPLDLARWFGVTGSAGAR